MTMHAFLRTSLGALIAIAPILGKAAPTQPAGPSIVLASDGQASLSPEATPWCGALLNLVLDSNTVIDEAGDDGVVQSLLNGLAERVDRGCPQATKAMIRVRSREPQEWNFIAVPIADGRWKAQDGSWRRKQNPVRLAAVLDRQSVEAEKMYQEIEADWNNRESYRRAQDAQVAHLAIDGGFDELASGLDAILFRDSRNWMFNRYDRGSIYRVRVLSRSRDGLSMQVYSEFRYNGGRPGWMKLRLSHGQVSCIELHDFIGHCRSVGVPGSWGVATGMIVVAGTAAMLSGPGIGHGSYDDSYDVVRRNTYQQPVYAPAPYVQPIGGAGGLYGCAAPPCM